MIFLLHITLCVSSPALSPVLFKYRLHASFRLVFALVRFQVFSLSFFFLTAFSVSSFHHQRSSPGFFFPDDLPQISSPYVLICLAVSSHHSSTFVVITSIPLDSLWTTHLMKFPFNFSSFSFHHLICFLPSSLLRIVAFTRYSIGTSTKTLLVRDLRT